MLNIAGAGSGPKWQDEDYDSDSFPQVVDVQLTGETLAERIEQCSPNARMLLSGLYEAFEAAIEIPNHMLRREFRDTRNKSARGRSLRWLRAQMEGEFYDDTDFGDEVEPHAEVSRFDHSPTELETEIQVQMYEAQPCNLKENDIPVEFIVNEERLERAQRNFCKKLIAMGILEESDFQ